MRSFVHPFVLAILASLSLGGGAAAATIPYVGCPGSDGGELQPAVQNQNFVDLDVTAATAATAAVYGGPYGPGLLGPRGWHCFWSASTDGNYGIFAAPTADDINSFQTYEDDGTTSFGIGYDYWNGVGSGREAVLPLAGHYFPTLDNGKPKQALDSAVANGQLGPDDLVPDFPADTVVLKSPDILSYTTPANQDGLGTWQPSQLHKSDLPVTGFLRVSLSGYTAAELVQVRLPDDLAALRTASLDHFAAYLAAHDTP